MTKTEQVVGYVRAGEWSKAMNIAKTFRLGFTKDEIRTIEIASAVEVFKCKELLKKRYLR